MAQGNLQQAIDYAKKNPKSDFARQLQIRIQSGAADEEAKQLGIDLSWAGRPTAISETGMVEAPKPTMMQGIKSAWQERGANVQDIAQRKQSPLSKGFQTLGQSAAFFLGDVPFEAVKKLTPDQVGAKVESVFQKIAQTQGVQNAMKHYNLFKIEHPELAGNIEAAVNIGSTIPVFKGGQLGAKATAKAAEKGAAAAMDAGSALKTAVSEIKAPAAVKAVKADLVPTADRIVNSSVTRALNLTQGDVRNIKSSTGNEVGEFLGQHNLIGANVDETAQNVNKFFKENYDSVRNEIGKVTKVYKKEEVPRIDEALRTIKTQIQEVPGLQEANTEIDALLKKKDYTLNDVQRVKELMDEHFQLYKVTGDVKEGVAKAGISNIRKDLRKFIETQVKENTGADIQKMNNNVSTARSIEDAIDVRSTRGLTKAMFGPSDILAFLAGAGTGGGPFTGAAAVIVKKLLESSSLQLKFAKWVDGLADKGRTTVVESLKKGDIPDEMEKILTETVS